ncbi:phosphatidate cytidylyltransferase [Blastococcus xanthinilyticus]|uniref:Phosphatidate cytidylyltransferase n=1 Tax=Blastococcus xanthinilyticus TaxID=1564164 RepID=A0A5S5CPE2_9ACTN|nr:phosphatidate cytidylyltransferase [Blastococcus xanthinilyticus]TYP82719.1 phosphatidate cytidylyltransferase [Blastococcus xanthinilyticus]
MHRTGSRPLPPLPSRAPVPVDDEPAGTAAVPPADPHGATAVPPAQEVAQLPTTEQPVSRAGRNLRAAIGVGVGLVAVIIASLLIWRPAFLGVLVAAILVAVVELTRALTKGGFHAPLVPLLVGVLAMEALAWSRGPTGLITGFFLTAVAVLLWRLAGGPVGYRRDAAAGILTALYVPFLAGFAVLLLVPADGAFRVLAFITTVIASDVGGYAAGVMFGKHAMAKSISPKKSWEGMAGSVLACMLVATPILVFALEAPWWGGLAFGAALAVSSTVGDLAESLIKRDLGIKDMGDLLPGHGGIMDRLDSLLPSAATAYLLLALVAPA